MRLMMQSLLEERFTLKIHGEKQQTRVQAHFTLATFVPSLTAARACAPADYIDMVRAWSALNNPGIKGGDRTAVMLNFNVLRQVCVIMHA